MRKEGYLCLLILLACAAVEADRESTGIGLERSNMMLGNLVNETEFNTREIANMTKLIDSMIGNGTAHLLQQPKTCVQESRETWAWLRMRIQISGDVAVILALVFAFCFVGRYVFANESRIN